MTGFRLSRRATFDIEDALAYLARSSEVTALRWEDELYGALHRLSRFPMSAQVRPEIAPDPVRVAVVGAYLVFYDPTAVPLLVLRVARASRNLTASFLSGAIRD